MGSDDSSPEDSSFVPRLAAEIARWEAEGLVRPDQAQALRARYGLLEHETPRTLRQSLIAQVISALGVVLVGVGVILLVGSNWQHIPNWARFVLLIGATVAAYGFGYRLAERSKTYPKLGTALLLLGSLLWGASIFLIGQSYHAGSPGTSDEARGVLIWFIGVLPLAYVLLSRLHLSLALVIGMVWVGLKVGERFPWVFVVYLTVGILLYAVGCLHAGRSVVARLDAPYRWLGLVCIFVTLYVFTFNYFWHAVSGTVGWAFAWDWLPPLLAIAGAAAIVLIVTGGRRDRTTLVEGAAMLALLLVAVGIMMAPRILTTTHAAYYVPARGAVLWVVWSVNFVLLAAEVGVVALGWVRNQPGLANLGVAVFFVHVITRYFDLLGATMGFSGLVFAGAGVLLVILGVGLERSRRSLLRAMAQRRQA